MPGSSLSDFQVTGANCLQLYFDWFARWDARDEIPCRRIIRAAEALIVFSAKFLFACLLLNVEKSGKCTYPLRFLPLSDVDAHLVRGFHQDIQGLHDLLGLMLADDAEAQAGAVAGHGGIDGRGHEHALLAKSHG